MGWTDTQLDELATLDADQLAARFAVAPAELIGRVRGSTVAMSGTFSADNRAVRFRPRHPFADGLTYGWVVREAGVDAPVVTIARPRVCRARIAEVAAIFPTASALPFNLLRIYIYFSRPMSEGDASRCVRMHVTETGVELAGAILAMEPELWDQQRRRLTVLLDPGRIKRGLVPNAQAGYPLVEGVAVTLVVDEEFRDATGAALRAGSRIDYAIGPAMRGRVDPAHWLIEAPAAGTTEPLAVQFDRPLDHALLRHCLHVTDAAGVAVRGRAWSTSGELGWQFTPDTAWTGGRYQIQVDSKLEDVAGNSVSRVFDRDLQCAEDDPVMTSTVAVDVVIAD